VTIGLYGPLTFTVQGAQAPTPVQETPHLTG